MPEMYLQIHAWMQESPETLVSDGVDVSDAEAFIAGLTGTFSVVEARLTCMTPIGERRELNQVASGETACLALLDNISGWLVENAAYE